MREEKTENLKTNDQDQAGTARNEPQEPAKPRDSAASSCSFSVIRFAGELINKVMPNTTLHVYQDGDIGLYGWLKNGDNIIVSHAVRFQSEKV